MKSRKIDYACSLAFPPENFEVTVKTVTPDGKGNQKITFLKKCIKDVDYKLLDPRVDTASMMIRSGATIDASSFRNILNITDIADLESHNYVQNQYVKQFIDQHRDELIASLKKDSVKVEDIKVE